MRISKTALLVLAAVLPPTCAAAQGEPSGQDDPPPEPTREQPSSYLSRTLFLGSEPPELRTLRHIQLLHADIAPDHSQRTHEEALELAARLVERARSGDPFEKLALRHSDALTGQRGAVLGSFARGSLAPQMDEFLFSAELGEVSDPIDGRGGVHILERTETYAAVLNIFVEGQDEAARERCALLKQRCDAGADFAELAREESDDEDSAVRGGQYAIFERGPNDTLMKAAAFRAAIGQVVGPFEDHLEGGLHLIQRVNVDEVDSGLSAQTWVRLRAILVRHDQAVGAVQGTLRDLGEANRIARQIHRSIVSGEKMEAMARKYNDDPGGREREGDLGWLHRGTPDQPRFMDRMFLLRVGELTDVLHTTAGFVIVRREQ